MTVAPPHVGALMIDVRCDASLGAPSARQGRCQLFVGHEPPHAIVYADRVGRHVRTWGRADTYPHDDCVDITRLPWMYGYPTPAWMVLDPSLQIDALVQADVEQ